MVGCQVVKYVVLVEGKHVGRAGTVGVVVEGGGQVVKGVVVEWQGTGRRGSRWCPMRCHSWSSCRCRWGWMCDRRCIATTWVRVGQGRVRRGV